MAQSSTESSRLNVGNNSKLPNVKSNLNGYLVKNVASEVTVDKSIAVSNFYKQLLIVSKPKPTVSSKLVFNNKSIEDNLFVDDKIVVSNVYPNPANDYANIDYNIKDNSAKATLSFHNLVGSQLKAVDLDSFERKVSVSTRNWENGIYFYQLIIDGKKVATKKLLVRHN